MGLPLAWLVSEFQPRRWLRILLGILALTMSVFLALGFSLLERFNYDLDALCRYLDETNVQSSKKAITLEPRRPSEAVRKVS